MRHASRMFFCCAAVMAGMLSAPAGADVKVTLRNGGSFRADSCRESGDRVICDRMGGTFEFGKKEVLSIKEVGGSADERLQDAVIEGSEAPQGKPAAGDTPAKGSRAEREKRLEEITREKLELRKERAALVEERERLQQTVKDSPEYQRPQKLDETQRKLSDFDTRLNRFNERVRQLDKEEKELLQAPATQK